MCHRALTTVDRIHVATNPVTFVTFVGRLLEIRLDYK